MRSGFGSSLFSLRFPGGIPSHASPEYQESIHEGGEPCYSLIHAFEAVLPVLQINGYKIPTPTLVGSRTDGVAP
jgi:phosphoketolase